jgi:hypothetical protein
LRAFRIDAYACARHERILAHSCVSSRAHGRSTIITCCSMN